MGMEMLQEPHTQTAAAELQNVLTSFEDSHAGYLQAADLVEGKGLAGAFREIAGRRGEIVAHVSGMIHALGAKSDTNGSTEGTVHRWWMRLRDNFTDEEFAVLLEECVRGESELLHTIRDVLDHGQLDAEQHAIISRMAVEVDLAIRTFNSALERE